jgi:hypothetical protein
MTGMHIRCWRWPTVLGLGLLSALPAKGGGQEVRLWGAAASNGDRPSYVEIQPPDKDLDPAAVLHKRLAQVQGLTDLQDLAKTILGDEKLKSELLKQIKAKNLPIGVQDLQKWRQLLADKQLAAGLKSPELQQFIEQQLRAPPQELTNRLKVDPGKYERALEALKALKQDEPLAAEGSGPVTTPPPTAGAPGMRPGDGTSRLPGSGVSTPGTEASPEEDGRAADAQFTEWMIRQMERLQDVRGPLRDSPAIQQMIRNLTKSLIDLKSKDAGGEAGNGLKRFLEAAQNSRLLSKDTWDRLRGLSLPRIPMPNMPHVNLPAVSLPPLPAPGVTSSGPSTGGGSAAVPLVLVFGLAAVLLWRVLRGSQAGRSDGHQRRWRLGPWPVDPRSIATRHDLVRAFEHLSLLKLGPQARHWNHLEIAAGLGGQEVGRRIVADHLASLYEQARYAPDGEALPPESVLAARRELLFLAGVTPA